MAISTDVTFAHRIEDAGFAAFLGAFGAMSPARASATGASLLQGLGPLTSAHRTALRNLRLAFPNETESWRADIARAMWGEIGRMAGEFPHMHAYRTEANGGAIHVEGAERFIEAGRTGAVFIAGHFSNWEIMAVAVVASGITCHVTYRPANNPLIDRRIVEGRRAYGVNLQSAKGAEGGMGLMRALARKETIVLMNDQKYNEGLAAPFFGHDCMTADGPARLALRFKLPLVPLSLRRTAPQAFSATVHPAIPLDYDAPLDEAAQAAVRGVNAFMEARVREAPEQWFWVHQRWPKSAWKDAGVL
ncbi:MAG: lysophospholipid acyltransferase family protein [Hyphomonadaceae bacterium]|nr:lysophospholipid acyltransferase family protein [Hyphomonadaceae bacterium]